MGVMLAARLGIATGQMVVGDLINQSDAQKRSAVGTEVSLQYTDISLHNRYANNLITLFLVAYQYNNMGRSQKFDYQSVVENELTAEPDGLSLDELLERCGLKVDRSTLFRHLVRLIENGRVERVGKARASRYRPLNIARMDACPKPPHTPRLAAQQVPEISEHQPPNATSPSTPGEAHQVAQSGRAEPADIQGATPDYGRAVKKAVRTVVRDWKRCNEVNLRIYLSLLVKPEQVEEIAAAVKTELAGLHEGNLDGYGLSAVDFSRYIAAASDNATGD